MVLHLAAYKKATKYKKISSLRNTQQESKSYFDEETVPVNAVEITNPIAKRKITVPIMAIIII
ncbi:MAG: hypothetical protein ACKVOU_04840 [Cytophagales bacterium]